MPSIAAQTETTTKTQDVVAGKATRIAKSKSVHRAAVKHGKPATVTPARAHHAVAHGKGAVTTASVADQDLQIKELNEKSLEDTGKGTLRE